MNYQSILLINRNNNEQSYFNASPYGQKQRTKVSVFNKGDMLESVKQLYREIECETTKAFLCRQINPSYRVIRYVPIPKYIVY